MAISGGVKFFSRSYCLEKDGTTAVASSGDASSLRALDRNPITYWRTSGSLDSITETFDITMPASVAFNRLFLLDHNFKSFSVKYWNGASYVDFSSVVGLAGAQATVTETTYARDTAYYEFAEVTSDRLRVSVTTTQVVDAEKYLSQLVVCSELGTLVGYPQIKGTELNRNLRNEKMLSGRILSLKSDEYLKVQLDFKDYPKSLSADVDLVFSLHDLEETFQVWLCGGRFGSNYFGKQMRGYRLRDLVTVAIIAPLKPVYSDSVYVNGLNFSVQLQEAVD